VDFSCFEYHPYLESRLTIQEKWVLGLGILRAAPAVGALLMTAFLARHTIKNRVGLRMFQAVIVFGAATVVFALSQWMWLSVLALVILGAADVVSVAASPWCNFPRRTRCAAASAP
jgi:hypothetical protein